MPRKGPFWDVVEGRAPVHPVGKALGLEFAEVDPEAGTVKTRFTVGPESLNPIGTVHGGVLATMLDDTMTPALVATLGPGDATSTVDMHVSFLSPARLGGFQGYGRVVRRGRRVAHLAAELRDEGGTVVATVAAVAQIRPAATI
jgi:uncharacterized protein (TIGR00369 family)